MEALILAAALLTADAEVRQSETFALAGELGRFPDEMLRGRDAKLADEHLEWLQTRKLADGDINPGIDSLIEEQQWVMQAYSNLMWSRVYLDHASFGTNPGEPVDENYVPLMSAHEKNLLYAHECRDKLRAIIGDDDYFAGRLPPPVTCQRRAAP